MNELFSQLPMASAIAISDQIYFFCKFNAFLTRLFAFASILHTPVIINS